MTICGRVLEVEVLERIKTAALELSPRQLAAAVCEWLGWKGPGGRFQLSMAAAILRRLHAAGIISLAKLQPPLGLKRKSAVPRDAQPLPKVDPERELNPVALGEADPIELILVGSRSSKNYQVWRGLLEEHHYLGSGPLAGHQLRYLIQGPQGWLGALAFSAAALRVKDRDRSIGWSEAARRENLPWVINNSRFLLRPGVTVKTLASQVLGLALRRVSQDWFEAFNYRPVLVETFVDLSRYRGGCYLAANWKLVGVTQGRGRQDRDRTAGLTKKLVLLYPLEQNFKEILGAVPLQPRLAPLPIPPPEPTVAEPQDWAEEEFGACDLGDQRLRKRLLEVGRDFFARPMMNLPQACGSRAKTKAVYRFFDHAKVTMHTVLQGHYAATARRAREEKVILAVQDTTDLNYSAHPATELLGPIGEREGTIGMLVHDTMAYNPAGTPLGLIDVLCWAREASESDTPKRERRHELALEQKESSKWLASWQAAQRLQEQCPHSTVVSVGDREADIYELFVAALSQAQGAKVLVRARQERVLKAEADQECSGVWEFMAQRATNATLTMELPRTPKRKARTAAMEIRYAPVELKPPRRKRGLGPVKLWAVTAGEVGAPTGEEPVGWKLLTNVEVGNLEKALEVLQWYTVRFQIEVYHRTLKSGCKVEDRQLGNAERIEACLAIDMVVAWRIVRLTKLGREVPEVSCRVYFEEAQWKALVAFVTKNPHPPEQPPTLREATRMLAIGLGGFLGRASDGEPGTETIWRGLQRLDDITAMWVVVMTHERWRSPTDRELNSS